MPTKDLKNLITRLYRFSIVGIISTAINYICFLLLYKTFFFHYILSSTIGYLIGLLLGYFINKNWTFVEKIEIKESYIVKYFFAQIIGLVICQLILLTLVEMLLLNPLLANFFALAIATIVCFILIDSYVFRSKGNN